MRRAIILAVLAGLLAGASIAPAEAKKKKPKPKPLVTFEAEGSLITANPADLNDLGVTRNEFVTNCAMPATQGLDGYVIELPEELSKIMSSVIIRGSDASGIYDLDAYFYSETCAPTGAASTEETDQTGFIPPGSKYAVVTAFFGTNISFTLQSTEVRS